MPLLNKIPPVAGLVDWPRRRPGTLLADRGYDHDKYRRLVWATGVKPVMARRGVGPTASAGFASGGNDATTYTKPSSASPPAPSSTATSNAFVRTS
ncbi:hypothetical protein GCM10017778_03050 [Streptomyces vinaceus]|nr:hypothetical protein GCM10017778_03050 [Streptomyces vinaceus]